MRKLPVRQFFSYDDADFEMLNNIIAARPESFISLDVPLAEALDILVRYLNEHPENEGKWMFNFDLNNRKLQRTASVNNPYTNLHSF